MAVKTIPDGYRSVTPYLIVNGADKAIDFYQRAFGAEELLRLEHGGKVAHAEVKIGDSVLMLGEPMPDSEYKDPIALGGSAVGLMIYVNDVDRAFEKAINAGGTQVRPVQDQFYGDRSGNLKDPFGHQWTLATHIEDVAPDEINRRFEEAYGAAASQA